jgi:putative sterol carrier protein
MENVPQTAREIIHSLPERFRPEKVEEGIEAILHFDISGDRGGQFTVEIKDGKCMVTDSLSGTPLGTVRATDANYEDIELGRTNAQMAFMMGKIKADNVMELMNFIGYFKRLYKKPE